MTNDIAATIFEWNLDEAVIIEPNTTTTRTWPNKRPSGRAAAAGKRGPEQPGGRLNEQTMRRKKDTICLLSDDH